MCSSDLANQDWVGRVQSGDYRTWIEQQYGNGANP